MTITSSGSFTTFITVLLAAALMAGCDRGQAAGRRAESPVDLSTILAGDSDAGRQVFVDLKCATCHAVPSEPSFEPPFGASPGPAIDARVGSLDVSYLLAAIMTPSHQISRRLGESVRQQLPGTLSPMGDFSQVMTVRQLVDLHSYVRSRATQVQATGGK